MSIIHTTLWSSPLINSEPIFTSPYPTLALTSNIYTLLTSSPSPQVPFFQCTSQLTTQETYIFPYMVFECHHNIWNLPVSTAVPSSNSFRDITAIGTHQHLGKILKDIFFSRQYISNLHRYSTQLNIILSLLSIGFHSYTKEVCMFSSNKFLLFIINLRILSFRPVGFSLSPYKSSIT